MKNYQIMQKDLKFNWHPCTQMKDHEFLPLIPIKKAKGVYLEDFEGNRYIDAISSWWVNIFGHSNKYINKKVKKQLKKHLNLYSKKIYSSPISSKTSS